ncbi:hypothetical protein BGX38DRAFT_187914 [Terfezia claveryi]|nr:hypothetical protein BGX38DRAFT_187914 [Terfezia claveryi]
MSNTDAISSIPLPEIPVKLRCTICNDLARRAVKLPCCEQSICGNCRDVLPGVCPVCDHSPLTPDICKDNTALRTTVAVFLRTAEKKHLLSLQKERKDLPKPAIAAIEPPTPTATTEPSTLKLPSQGNPSLVTPQVANVEIDEVKSEEPNAMEEAIQSREPTEDPAQDETTEVTAEIEGQDVTSINEIQPQIEAMVNQNGQWFSGQAQMYPMNYRGQGWVDYNQMTQNGWMGGYGNMMSYDNSMAYGMGYGGMGNIGNGGQDGMGWGEGASGRWNQGNMSYDRVGNGGGYYSASSTSGGYSHQQFHENQFTAQHYHDHFQDGRSRQPFPPGGNNRGSIASVGSGGGGEVVGPGAGAGASDDGQHLGQDPQNQQNSRENAPPSAQEQSSDVPGSGGSVEPEANGHPAPAAGIAGDPTAVAVTETDNEAGRESNDNTTVPTTELPISNIPGSVTNGNEFYQQTYMMNYPIGQYHGMNPNMNPNMVNPVTNNYGGYRGNINGGFRGVEEEVTGVI